MPGKRRARSIRHYQLELTGIGKMSAEYRGMKNRGMNSFSSIALLSPVFAVAQSSTPAEAIALEQQGKFAEAAQVWQAAVTGSIRTMLRRLPAWEWCCPRNEVFRSRLCLRKALALNPKLAGVQLNLGLAEFKQGHFRAAAAAFHVALTSDPSNNQARTLLGLSYYGAQQFAEATKYLGPAAKADPGNVELHRLLAQSCLWAKNYPCALEEFRQLQQQSPDSAPDPCPARRSA